MANIALNGIEKIHNIIRYADDMVIILKPEDDLPPFLAHIMNFLDDLGLKIKWEKTRLVSATDGFNFLGWHNKSASQREVQMRPFRGQLQDIPQDALKVSSIVPTIDIFENLQYPSLTGFPAICTSWLYQLSSTEKSGF